MKTRIVHTRFWSDSYILQLSPSRKLLFLFYLTNDKVNMPGIYEMTIEETQFFTGLPPKTIKETQEVFMLAKRMFFFEDWICLINQAKYNCYGSGPRQELAYIKELSYIPTKFWASLSHWDTSIHTSIYTRLNTEYINHKEEIIKEGFEEGDKRTRKEKELTADLIESFEKSTNLTDKK